MYDETQQPKEEGDQANAQQSGSDAEQQPKADDNSDNGSDAAE